MFILQLNEMSMNAEYVAPVAWAENAEALLALLESEKVEPYQEGSWRKVFRKGGPLEWFNDPGPNVEPWIGVSGIVDVGTEEDWIQRAIEQFQSLKRNLFQA